MVSLQKETTFCTHKGYNTVAPCDDSCQSLQKEGEWWDRATEDLSGIYIKKKESEWSTEKTYSECFFDECAMTQKLSPEQCQYATDYFSKFISSAISTEVSNREKEIAEEVKKMKETEETIGGMALGYNTAINEVLQILKH